MYSRRQVIQSYVTYDARKKGRSAPDLDSWQWDNADALDAALRTHEFKPGVLAGYLWWDLILIGRDELLRCAIWNGIDVFRGKSQALSILCIDPAFRNWQPKHSTEWFDVIEHGGYDPTWIFILRPALASESPARWYIEDGTGRGICLLRRLLRNPDDTTTVAAFVGIIPDAASAFIQQHPELLTPA
jgi:hypothetical protein